MRDDATRHTEPWTRFVKAAVVTLPLLLFFAFYRMSSDDRYVTFHLRVLGDFPKGFLFDLTVVLLVFALWLAAERNRVTRALFTWAAGMLTFLVVLFRVTDHYYYAATKVPLNTFVLYTNLSSANEGAAVVLSAPLCLLLGVAVGVHYATAALSQRYASSLDGVARVLAAPAHRLAGLLSLAAVLLLVAINAYAMRAHPRRADVLRAISGEYNFVSGLPRFFREEALKTYAVAPQPARPYLPPVAAPRGAPVARRPNVFLITVESFNALYTLPPKELNPALTEEVMPFFKSLASDGQFFPHVYTSSAYTFNGIIAVLCSQYTMSEAVWGSDCLPQLLGRNGYQTFSFVSIPQLRPYRIDNFQAMGFDRAHIFDAARMRVGKKNVYFNAMSDKELFDNAAAVADSASRASRKPLFIHVSTDGMHVPGLPPHPGCSAYAFPAGLEVDGLTNRMLNAAHCTDHDLATYIARLKALGLYDDALVIITADHAFNLSFWSHKETELARIPMFVKLPKAESGAHTLQVNRLNAQVDIMPTIVDYLGLTTNRPMYGTSLFGSAPPQRALPGISNSRLLSLATDSGAVLHLRGKNDVTDRRVQDMLDDFYDTVLYFDQHPKAFDSTVARARSAGRP